MKKNKQNFFFFFQLVRYQNLAIIVFTLLFVKYFLISPSLVKFTHEWTLLIFSTVLIAAGGYIINDFYDRKIDEINKPDKVLIGKVFTPNFALYLYAGFNIMAIILGFFTSIYVGLIQIFCVLSLYLYAFYLKKIALVGNVLVAFLSALVVLIVNVLYLQHFLLVYIFGIFAFFISLIRELIKDIEDIAGDRVGECRTFPILYGILNTKRLIYCIIAIFIATLFAVPYFIFSGQNQVGSLVIVILLLFLIYKLYKAREKSDFHFLSIFCKLLMLVGMLGMLPLSGL
jgi:4-hydroxybenzoate polyprenyltransferase